MTEGDAGRSARRRRFALVAGTAAGVAAAVLLGVVLARTLLRWESPAPAADRDPAARFIATYRESLESIRRRQRATTDPEELGALAAKERELRVIAAAGLAGLRERAESEARRNVIEDEVREILSAFPDAGAIIKEIEGPVIGALAEEDVGFARDVTALLEFLIREEGRVIDEKRRELEGLKAREAELREELEPGHEGHDHD